MSSAMGGVRKRPHAQKARHRQGGPKINRPVSKLYQPVPVPQEPAANRPERRRREREEKRHNAEEDRKETRRKKKSLGKKGNEKKQGKQNKKRQALQQVESSDSSGEGSEENSDDDYEVASGAVANQMIERLLGAGPTAKANEEQSILLGKDSITEQLLRNTAINAFVHRPAPPSEKELQAKIRALRENEHEQMQMVHFRTMLSGGMRANMFAMLDEDEDEDEEEAELEAEIAALGPNYAPTIGGGIGLRRGAAAALLAGEDLSDSDSD